MAAAALLRDAGGRTDADHVAGGDGTAEALRWTKSVD
jgi:hypothetical protein